MSDYAQAMEMVEKLKAEIRHYRSTFEQVQQVTSAKQAHDLADAVLNDLSPP